MVRGKAVKQAVLFRKADTLILMFWGMAALILFLLSARGIGGDPSGACLVIISGNETVGRYELDKDQTIRIGEGNTCEIKEGSVRMVSADCPDKLCVKSHGISKPGESIVCLPNNVILKITGQKGDADIDAVSE